LTVAERATQDFLLEQPRGQGAGLCAQIDHARVIGECHCVCATIDLAVDPAAPRWNRRPADGRIAASAVSRPDAPQHPGELLLHVIDGRLAELEIADWRGDNELAEFPPVRTWEPPRAGGPWPAGPEPESQLGDDD